MNTFENVRKELDLLASQGMPLCGVTVRRGHEKLYEYGISHITLEPESENECCHEKIYYGNHKKHHSHQHHH